MDESPTERGLRERIDAFGPEVRALLLNVLNLADEDRAARIGELWADERTSRERQPQREVPGREWTCFRNLPLGTSVTRRFIRRGTFRYYCTIHGRIVNGVCTGMCGRIVVS